MSTNLNTQSGTEQLEGYPLISFSASTLTWSAKKTARPFFLAATLGFLSACASIAPPIEQVAVSSAAVSRAASAGGMEAAPADMQLAQQKLDRAKLAMKDEDYKLALSLSEEAQLDAQLAEAKARSSKTRLAASEMQKGVRVLREEIERKTK